MKKVLNVLFLLCLCGALLLALAYHDSSVSSALVS